MEKDGLFNNDRSNSNQTYLSYTFDRAPLSPNAVRDSVKHSTHESATTFFTMREISHEGHDAWFLRGRHLHRFGPHHIHDPLWLDHGEEDHEAAQQRLPFQYSIFHKQYTPIHTVAFLKRSIPFKIDKHGNTFGDPQVHDSETVRPEVPAVATTAPNTATLGNTNDWSKYDHRGLTDDDEQATFHNHKKDNYNDNDEESRVASFQENVASAVLSINQLPKLIPDDRRNKIAQQQRKPRFIDSDNESDISKPNKPKFIDSDNESDISKPNKPKFIDSDSDHSTSKQQQQNKKMPPKFIESDDENFLSLKPSPSQPKFIEDIELSSIPSEKKHTISSRDLLSRIPILHKEHNENVPLFISEKTPKLNSSVSLNRSLAGKDRTSSEINLPTTEKKFKNPYDGNMFKVVAVSPNDLLKFQQKALGFPPVKITVCNFEWTWSLDAFAMSDNAARMEVIQLLQMVSAIKGNALRLFASDRQVRGVTSIVKSISHTPGNLVKVSSHAKIYNTEANPSPTSPDTQNISQVQRSTSAGALIKTLSKSLSIGVQEHTVSDLMKNPHQKINSWTLSKQGITWIQALAKWWRLFVAFIADIIDFDHGVLIPWTFQRSKDESDPLLEEAGLYNDATIRKLLYTNLTAFILSFDVSDRLLERLVQSHHPHYLLKFVESLGHLLPKMFAYLSIKEKKLPSIVTKYWNERAVKKLIKYMVKFFRSGRSGYLGIVILFRWMEDVEELRATLKNYLSTVDGMLFSRKLKAYMTHHELLLTIFKDEDPPKS